MQQQDFSLEALAKRDEQAALAPVENPEAKPEPVEAEDESLEMASFFVTLSKGLSELSYG